MEIYAHSKRCARHRYQGIRLVRRVQRNTTYAFMHRVQQERANTYSRQIQFIVLKLHQTSLTSKFGRKKKKCMCMNVTYPHKTVALCAGCILQCTCRLWWSGRWGDTAGNSLHCYYCRDCCLGTQKHENKNTKQIKEELET